VDSARRKLAADIDALLAFLADAPRPPGSVESQDEWERRCHSLDFAVYKGAVLLGLKEHLPGPGPRGASSIGFLNIPVIRTMVSLAPGDLTDWSAEMEVLKALALALAKKKRRRSAKAKADLAEMLGLRDVEGLTHYQIGRRLGISADAVRMRLAREEKRRKKGR
jgi:hypothetical protein